MKSRWQSTSTSNRPTCSWARHRSPAPGHGRKASIHYDRPPLFLAPAVWTSTETAVRTPPVRLGLHRKQIAPSSVSLGPIGLPRLKARRLTSVGPTMIPERDVEQGTCGPGQQAGEHEKTEKTSKPDPAPPPPPVGALLRPKRPAPSPPRTQGPPIHCGRGRDASSLRSDRAIGNPSLRRRGFGTRHDRETRG